MNVAPNNTDLPISVSLGVGVKVEQVPGELIPWVRQVVTRWSQDLPVGATTSTATVQLGEEQVVLVLPVYLADGSCHERRSQVRRSTLSQAQAGAEMDRIGSFLALAGRLLPADERAGWVEEQRSYLADLPGGRPRWQWVFAQMLAMPRYVYTVRTGREKEPA
ncbi:hypothetical protein ACFWZZ_10870 [[Kitasatospora] papulosa]|uniref:hypothetical protein n=1 Tax=[Kitasatospora] papulosa TaxID=1464011 RepID=UPI0036BBDE2B